MSERDFLYLVANDEMLTVIDALKKNAAKAKSDFIDYVARLGGVVRYGENGQTTFLFPGGVPAGWVQIQTARPAFGAYAEPQWPSEAASKLHSASLKQDLQREFNSACHKMAPTSHFNSYTYSFETLGDKTIIKCPPRSNGEYIVPPDCKVLSYPEYLALREAIYPTPKAVIKPFTKKFGQD